METKLVGEFADPELVDDQTIMVWLWRKLLFVCQTANDVVICMYAPYRELKWLVVKFPRSGLECRIPAPALQCREKGSCWVEEE
jgi:hypothetical protein